MIGLVTIEAASFAYRAWAHRVTVGSAAVPTRRAQHVGSPEITVVVLGESSARGVPYCRGQNEVWLSVGHIVEWQLSLAFPDRKIQVQSLAEDGATLEGALRKLNVLPNRPDAVILFSGHNEISGRFPLDRRVPHYADEMTWHDHISGWVRSVSPLDNLLQDGLDAQAKGIHPRLEDQRQIDVPACTAAESARLRDDFRSRLDGLLTYCRRSGALPTLIIPPGNDGGFEPNRSVLDPSLPRAERDALGRMFASIRAAEKAEPSRCRTAYEALLARHPEFADAHFRLARLLERAGAYGEANRH